RDAIEKGVEKAHEAPRYPRVHQDARDEDDSYRGKRSKAGPVLHFGEQVPDEPAEKILRHGGKPVEERDRQREGKRNGETLEESAGEQFPRLPDDVIQVLLLGLAPARGANGIRAGISCQISPKCRFLARIREARHSGVCAKSIQSYGFVKDCA